MQISFQVPFKKLVERIVEYTQNVGNGTENEQIVQDILAHDFDWGFEPQDYKIEN